MADVRVAGMRCELLQLVRSVAYCSTANEWLTRDLDNNSGTTGNNFNLAYDAAGNMTDDGRNFEYVYDGFGRLRQVKRTDNQALVAEYRYNGLGYRLSWKCDTDTDGDVDGSDVTYFFAYDLKWRPVASFRGTDVNPKERFVFQFPPMLCIKYLASRGLRRGIDTGQLSDRGCVPRLGPPVHRTSNDAHSGWNRKWGRPVTLNHSPSTPPRTCAPPRARVLVPMLIDRSQTSSSLPLGQVDLATP